ncbi:hypothetical protein JW926_00835 [Candidatus Sumerlaeota bacterium]|nr:hypothetical protein [Candidatus Sumerlaeota bacterium]
MRSFVYIFAFLFLLNGCSLFHKKPFSPNMTQYPPNLSPQEISRILGERHKILPKLWASGKITIWGKGIKGKKYFHATLLYQEPDSLRLRGSRMITSTLFEFIVNSNRMAVVWNREKMWFHGAKDEWLRYPELSLGIDPLFLPKALLIHQELSALFENKKISRWQKKGKACLFIREGIQDSTEAFLVGADDLLIREAALYNSRGNLVLKIKFLRYDLFDGEILPVELETFFPETSVTAKVRLDAYKFPETFDEAVFSLAPQPDFDSHPLQDLAIPPLIDNP